MRKKDGEGKIESERLKKNHCRDVKSHFCPFLGRRKKTGNGPTDGPKVGPIDGHTLF